MGATVSKTTATAVNDLVKNSINKTLNTCATKASNVVNTKIESAGDISGNTIDIKQSAKVDLKCAFSSKTQQKIVDQIISDLKAASDTKGGDLFTSGVLTASDLDTLVQTSVEENVTNETRNTTKADIENKVNTEIKSYGGKVTDQTIIVAQGIDNVTKNMFDNMGFQEAATQISNKLDASNKTEAGGLFNMLGGNIFWIVIGLVAVAAIGFVVKKGLEKKGTPVQTQTAAQASRAVSKSIVQTAQKQGAQAMQMKTLKKQVQQLKQQLSK